MAITKSRLLSLDIYPDVVSEECRLWHRFSANYKNGDLSNFIPNESESITWENRINLYSPENRVVYQPIMDRLCREMEIQDEVFSPVLSTFANEQIKMTSMAIKFLSESDDCLDFALRSMVGRIVIVNCDELVGCSSPLFLGLIIIAPKGNWTIYDYMENIIHEMSHIELYIKQIVDPLVIKGSYLKSPFRNQPRPASGVYHAAFVLARIIKYFKPFAGKSQHTAVLKKRIDEWRLLLDETLSQFYNREILTPAGQKIFNEMNAVVLRD
ncbi:hypothetical protein EJP617_08000 [Erwinia sp. Ejp617]|nr:HEXXH motif-containing putative peptide modification protein [Erwinia sp. Ejp617]ADP10481.1 hypothetical protein EJP617_08000 [Erwinia sp. Ejp617]